MRRGLVLAALAVVVGLGTLVADVPARGLAYDTVTGTGSIGGGPGAVGPVTINARKPAGAPPTAATGTFVAHGTLDLEGMVDVPLYYLAGPVTCLDVVGNKAGLIYPVKSANPSFFVGLSVKITVVDNGGAGRDTTGFLGPAPAALLGGCAPSAAPLPIEGHISVHRGG